jgi:hypothetical protein
MKDTCAELWKLPDTYKYMKKCKRIQESVNIICDGKIVYYSMKYNCAKLWKSKKVKTFVSKLWNQFKEDYIKTHGKLPEHADTYWLKGAKKAFDERCKKANTRKRELHK